MVEINNYCENYYKLPQVSAKVDMYWLDIQSRIDSKELDGKDLSGDEAFAKYFIDYAIINETRFEQKCPY